jgi:predicted nucleotidyltransferase
MMSVRHSTRDRQMRQRIAQEAARLIVSEGIRDYLVAKRKAAVRLGAPDTQNLPRNIEVEVELAAYQRLFQEQEQPLHLQALRMAAAEAMRFFERYDPRLTGSVLSGTAGEHSDINLHLFAESPEEVTLFLMESQVPFEESQRRLRLNQDDYETYPAIRFLAGEMQIEAVIFPLNGLRQAPRSPLDGKPMSRASLRRVEELLYEMDVTA